MSDRRFKDLPSLAALRVFEAAGRHLSFTNAAAELHVTTSAVSRQIRALEEELGRRLFERQPRGLALTKDGATYLAEVADALRRLDQASASCVATARAARFASVCWRASPATGWCRGSRPSSTRTPASTS